MNVARKVVRTGGSEAKSSKTQLLKDKVVSRRQASTDASCVVTEKRASSKSQKTGKPAQRKRDNQTEPKSEALESQAVPTPGPTLSTSGAQVLERKPVPVVTTSSVGSQASSGEPGLFCFKYFDNPTAMPKLRDADICEEDCNSSPSDEIRMRRTEGTRGQLGMQRTDIWRIIMTTASGKQKPVRIETE